MKTTTGMDHKELYELGSQTLRDLKAGKVKPQFAHEMFNGIGKLTAGCKTELKAIQMGFDVDVPLLGLTKTQSAALRKPRAKRKS